jgi:hypothetical protein
MAIRFDTYAQLGEAYKRKNPEYNDRDSESLGIQVAEKFGDKANIKIREEDDRASFKYDPEEGFNVLKTLGNIPSSAKNVVEDLATAVFNPIDTAEAIGRGAAGGVEHLLGTDISPENKRLASQMAEGIGESFSARGLQERPLDALGFLAGGTGAVAKGLSTAGKIASGARVMPRLSKAGKIAQRKKAAVRRSERRKSMPGFTAGAEKLAKGADKAGQISQAFDPGSFVPRAGLATAGIGAVLGGKAAIGTGKLALGGAKAAGNKIVIEPIKTRYKGSSAERVMNDAVEAMKGVADMAAPDMMSRWNGMFNRTKEAAKETSSGALDTLKKATRDAQKVTDEKLGAVADEISGGNIKDATTRGVFDGLVSQWMGFTTGLGSQLINQIIDISRMSSKKDGKAAREIMLEAANRKLETGVKSVGEEIADELVGEVNKYIEGTGGLKEASRATRDALQMDDVIARSGNIADDLLTNPMDDSGRTIPNEFGIQIIREPDTVQVVKDFGVDYVKNPNAGKVRVSLEGSAIAELPDQAVSRKNVKDIYEDILNLEDEMSVFELDKKKRTIDDLIPRAEGESQAALIGLRKVVYKRIEDAYLDDANIEKLKVKPDRTINVDPEGTAQFGAARENVYIKAMAEYERNVERIRRIQQTLGVKGAQKKFGGTDFEVIRNEGNPTEALKKTLDAFGDNDKELGMQNLIEILEATGNKTLIPKIAGFAMRPVFGGGLVVRSEISNIGRGVVGFNILNSIMAPVALASFSPRYGGMLLSYLYTPGNASKIAGDVGKFGREVTGKGVKITDDLRKMAAEKFKKNPKDVTPNDAESVLNDAKRMDQEGLGNLDENQKKALRNLVGGGYRAVSDAASDYVGRTRVTRPRTAARFGRSAVTAEEQGEKAQERRNLLSTLGQTQR